MLTRLLQLFNQLIVLSIRNESKCAQDLFAGDNSHNKNTSVGYQDLIHVFTELARCVQNNKTQCATVFSEAKEWIDFYRRGLDFEVKFINVNHIDSNTTRNTIPHQVHPSICPVIDNLVGDPLPATTRAVTVASRQPRKQSSLEKRRVAVSKNVSFGTSQTQDSTMLSQMSCASNHANEDVAFLPDPQIRTRSCLLCAGKGHGQFTCPKMIAYGGTPLPKNDVQIRQQLQTDLCR